MMDQMELDNLIEKIKKRRIEGDIKNAVRVADKIPWHEIEDVNVLMFGVETYELAENYQDAKAVLDYAYEVAPIKNRLYFALAHINILCKNLKDGLKFYVDFIDDFPDDDRKYVLQYEILKVKGAPLEQQRRVLNEYVREENDEKMTFEMAVICDKLGLKDDVIYYADHIVQFFGVKNTGYGKGALLLKKKYQPLTEEEERLLEMANIGYIKDDDREINYTNPLPLVNVTKLKDEQVSIPVEKVGRDDETLSDVRMGGDSVGGSMGVGSAGGSMGGGSDSGSMSGGSAPPVGGYNSSDGASMSVGPAGGSMGVGSIGGSMGDTASGSMGGGSADARRGGGSAPPDVDDDDELDESKYPNKITVSYAPDEESYLDKEKNNMAFLKNKVVDKEKLKQLISRLKEEDDALKAPMAEFRKNSFQLERRDIKVKLADTKLHMIVEAYSKNEGIDIAKKELTYIHKFLDEEVKLGKLSAYSLNEKGFAYYEPKIVNRDLIIESAGQLSNDVIDAIEEYIINKKSNTIFALVDVINNFDKLAMARPSFIARFDIYSVLSAKPQEKLIATTGELSKYKEERKEDAKKAEEKASANGVSLNQSNTGAMSSSNTSASENVNNTSSVRSAVNTANEGRANDGIKKDEKGLEGAKNDAAITNSRNATKEMSVDEFVDACKEYAKNIDCVLPGKTIPALYEKVEEMQEQHVPLNDENVAALMEEAADRAEKPKLFSKPKYSSDGCLIISEEHFNF